MPVALGGGAGIALTDSLILCTGGINKDIFLSALQREEMMKAAVTGGNQAAVDSLKSEAKHICCIRLNGIVSMTVS